MNHLIEDLVRPTTEMARVIGDVAKGDLTQTVALEAESQLLKGEFLRTAKMVNAMVKQLDDFAAEVTRVAREIGTEGKLGGQAQVSDVRRRVEGPHRKRQHDGRQFDGSGAQYCRCHHSRRQRRPL